MRQQERLFFLMPLIIVSFLIVILDRRPGDLMHRLFTAGVVPPVRLVLILLPGAIKRFFIDLLGMRRQHVPDAIG